MARKAPPEFTPDELQQIDLIQRKVLDTPPGGSPGESEPPKPAGEAPRPMLPNYYAHGGKVQKYGSDTHVMCKSKFS